MPAILSVKEITKKIGGKTLVDRISFEVQEGEVFGFLGPNGAGKTTTIRMLVGLIKPTSGSIEIGGYNVQKNFKEAMRQIGSIVENPELYGYLTGWENLEQFARMLGNVSHERIEEVVKQVNLEKRIHEKVKTYSLGMKQRLGIAQALLGRPKLLILDEPTNGLDPKGIRELRAFVKKLVKEEGMSVFISSHLLSEIQAICNRVVIINHGKTITVGTIEDLMNKANEKVEWVVEPLDVAEKILSEEEKIVEIIQEENKIISLLDANKVGTYNKRLVESGVTVHRVTPTVTTLEDFFMELTGGDGIA